MKFEDHPDLNSAVEDAAKTLQAEGWFEEGSVEINTEGELNIVLITNGRERAAVKLNREDPYKSGPSLFEALITAELEPFHGGTPLELPHVIDQEARPELPKYVALSYVEGDTLSDEEVLGLSNEEQRELGAALSQFIIWFSEAMPLATYQDSEDVFEELSNRGLDGVRILDLPTRAERIDEYFERFEELDQAGYSELRWLVDDIGATYYMSQEEGGPLGKETHFVGHDDLRPANWTFRHVNSMRKLRGIFDFGSAKGDSSIERELRHLALISNTATEAAIEHYEKTTGQTVDRELLDFWADAQVATVCAAIVLRGVSPYIPWSKLDYLKRRYPPVYEELRHLAPTESTLVEDKGQLGRTARKFTDTE